MGYTIKVLGFYVLNPKMMLFGEDNNRQTDRQTYSSQNAQTHSGMGPCTESINDISWCEQQTDIQTYMQ